LWLAPEQGIILPISDKYNEYAHQMKEALAEFDIRVTVDDRNETIGRKIRDAEVHKLMYMFIVGEKEAAENKASIRKQGEGDLGAFTLTEIMERMKEEVKVPG
jgi:threonyl-tRNA synthetase